MSHNCSLDHKVWVKIPAINYKRSHFTTLRVVSRAIYEQSSSNASKSYKQKLKIPLNVIFFRIESLKKIITVHNLLKIVFQQSVKNFIIAISHWAWKCDDQKQADRLRYVKKWCYFGMFSSKFGLEFPYNNNKTICFRIPI